MTIQAERNPVVDIADVVNKMTPLIFGKSDVTSGTVSGIVDPTTMGRSTQLFDLLQQRGSSTAQADGVIADILYRAQLAFAPVLGEEKGAGMYNSTVKKQLANEAIARATAASADAVFKMQQQSLDTAAQIANSQVQATKGTSTNTQTKQPGQGKNILGTTLGGIALGEAYKGAKGGISDTVAAAAKAKKAKDAQDAADAETASYGGQAPFGEDAALIGDESASQVITSVDSTVAGDLSSAATVNDGGADAATVATLDTGPNDAATVIGEGDAVPPIEADYSVSDTPAAVDAVNATDAGSDALDLTDIFGGGGFGGDFSFADGGLVGDRIGYTDEATAARLSKRVSPNIVSGGGAGASPNASLASSTKLGKTKPGEDMTSLLQNAISGGDASAPGVATEADASGPAPGAGLAANVAGHVATAVGLTGLGPVGGMVGLGLALSNIVSGIVAAATAAATGQVSGESSADSVGPAPGVVGPSNDNDNLSQETAEADAAANDAGNGPVGSEGGVAGSPAGGGVGTSTAASEGTGGSNTGNEGGNEGGGDSGGDGGSSGGDGFFEGGLVIAKDAKDMEGIDKEKIYVTPDEYVLPADVVSIIGKDNLDELIDRYHTPVRKGR